MTAAAVILKDGVDAVPVHPLALPHVLTWIDWRDRQTSPFVSRLMAQEVIGCSQSKLLRLEASKEIVSILDGAKRKISVTSIIRRGVALALASYPVDGPELKARKPAKRYQKPPRVRGRRRSARRFSAPTIALTLRR